MKSLNSFAMTKIKNDLLRELSGFALVGFSAMAVHWIVAISLADLFGVNSDWRAVVINGLAFIPAFIVSYLGHFFISFRHAGNHGRALPRFFLTALNGLICNELLLIMLLQLTELSFNVALLIVLIAVAAITFGLSKLWAFRQPQASEAAK